MPGGTTDYNLTRVERALGIQNPDWEIPERIQLTMSVGSMELLTPAHQAPTGVFGALQPAVVGQFSFFQIYSRAPGGTRVNFTAISASVIRFGLIAAALPPTVTLPDAGPFSLQPSLASVDRGANVANALGTDRPIINGAAGPFPVTSPPNQSLWMPPGTILIVQNDTANFGINFAVCCVDVPVVEGGR